MTSTRRQTRAAVSALLVAAGLGAAVWLRPTGTDKPQGTAPAPTVAVLPFNTAGGEAATTATATGLRFDLADRLETVASIQCISAKRIEASYRHPADLAALGKLLGARFLIVGEVAESASDLTLSMQVVDVVAGDSAGRFQLVESKERVLELQRRLAQRVVATLGADVSRSDRKRLARYPTRSLKAWDDLARGLEYLQTRTDPRGLDFARDLLHRALRLDPEFRQARALLSQALWLSGLTTGNDSLLREAETEARQVLEDDSRSQSAAVALVAARQALARAPGLRAEDLEILRRVTKPDQAMRDLASTWLRVGELELAESAWLAASRAQLVHWLDLYGYGQFLVHGGRVAEAEQAFAQAAQLAPDDLAWPREMILGAHLRTGDLAAAVATFEKLARPLRDADLIRQVAVAYSILGRLEAAEDLFRQAIDLQPDSARLHLELGDVLHRAGRQIEATAQYSRALQLAETAPPGISGAREAARLLALSAAKAGECARGLSLAATLRRRSPASATALVDLAVVFIVCGEEQAAIEALGAALDQGISPDLVLSRPELGSLDPTTVEQLLQSHEPRPPDP